MVMQKNSHENQFNITNGFFVDRRGLSAEKIDGFQGDAYKNIPAGLFKDCDVKVVNKDQREMMEAL